MQNESRSTPPPRIRRLATIIPLTTLAAATLAASPASHAQQYPTRPVRLVVPYAPSGGIQVLARLLGDKLTDVWGKSVVIENRPGGGANVGTEHVARSPPDGYTFVAVSSTVALAASASPKPNYDVLKDLATVVLATRAPFVLSVNPKVGATTVKGLLEAAKARPGGLNFASAGQGTTTHFAIELLKSKTGIPVVHVPYKGSALAMSDLIEGRVDAMFATPAGIMPHVRERRLLGLAVTGTTPSSSAPGLPTMAEAGVPGYDVSVWFGLLAPAGTPADIIGKVHTDVVKVLAMPDVAEKLKGQGQEVAPMAPAEFAAFLRTEVNTWADIVKRAGVRFD